MGQWTDLDMDLVDSIRNAGDVVYTPTSEATAGSKTRRTKEEWSSATVGKKLTVTYTYINGPNDNAWGAMSSEDVTITDL